jgi:hypothetical protein
LFTSKPSWLAVFWRPVLHKQSAQPLLIWSIGHSFDLSAHFRIQIKKVLAVLVYKNDHHDEPQHAKEITHTSSD